MSCRAVLVVDACYSLNHLKLWPPNRFLIIYANDHQTGNYGLAESSRQAWLIIRTQLGFRATAANLLSVPVYVLACLVTFAVAILGDRLGHRGYRGYLNL